jgi:hypothetical protein
MTKPINSTWQAVSIVPGAGACTVVQELRGKRFLTRAAPRLPLAECNNQDQCQCKYKRYTDRRDSPRRAEDQLGGNQSTTAPKPERRRPGERRDRRP